MGRDGKVNVCYDVVAAYVAKGDVSKCQDHRRELIVDGGKERPECGDTKMSRTRLATGRRVSGGRQSGGANTSHGGGADILS